MRDNERLLFISPLSREGRGCCEVPGRGRSKIVCDVIAVMVHSRSLHPRKPNICLFPYRLRPTNLQNDRID